MEIVITLYLKEKIEKPSGCGYCLMTKFKFALGQCPYCGAYTEG